MKIIKLPVGDYQANCYILVIDNECLIVDPGDEAFKIKEITNKYNIKAILITHHHFDHVGALNEFSEYPIYDFKKGEGVFEISKFKFEIINTKGHKEDCVSFLFDKDMFTGDFLFKETIGRTDFDGSNHNEMLKSLDKIKKYNKEIKIHPGHGDSSTLAHEFNNNYFLK